MKAKTRILAMLLTVLMVVGILPLSLFALDGAVPSVDKQAAYVGRDLDEIKTEFDRIGMTLSRYQTFSKLDTDTLTGFQNSYGHAQLGYCNNSNPNEPFVDTRAYCDYNDDTDGGHFSIVNQKNSGISIVTEEGGNKALLFSKPENNATSENYISSKNFGGLENAYHDIYVSFDIKMAGDKMAGATLFRFVHRPKMMQRTLRL